MRGIISRIGQEAGISALYWKYGVCLYERTTRSHALIEQRSSNKLNTWSGQIAVTIRGGQAEELLGRLQAWIKREIERSGCRGWEMKRTCYSVLPDHPKKAGRGRAVGPESKDAAPERTLEFTMPPSDTITYCVSYAWNDESKAVVDRLCAEAEKRGIKILRDTNGLGIGESITRFMKKLGAGDRVFVILSDKYLKSPYCMSELLEVWRNCKEEDDVFRQRIRVYRLSDARMMSLLERLDCAAYWDDELQKLDEVVRKRGPGLLAGADLNRYKLMREFVHRVGDMLALIADTLQPQNFDELVKYGFGDEIPPSPSK